MKFQEFVIQCAATVSISFLGYQSGFISTWPSYNTAMFRSNETVLSAPMTSFHISLLGSLFNIGGLAISPFCGYAFNTFGRKNCTFIFGLPFVVSWLIISMTNNVHLILLAMAIVGIGIAGQYTSLIFISELAHDSIRGGLTACPAAGFFLGILISNLMGGILSYDQVVRVSLGASVLGLIPLTMLKESPVYLILIGKEKEAAKSISFYRKLSETSKEIDIEISKIKEQLDPGFKTLSNSNEPEAGTTLITSKEQPTQTKRISAWKYLKNSKSSQRALVMALIIMSLTGLMGAIVLQVYAEPLFAEAVPSLQPNFCAVLVAVVFMIASLVCIVLVDKCGRKNLLIYTSIAAGICTLLLGTLLQFHWAPQWFTALLIYVYCFSYTTGCATIPLILVAEIFLPEVRSLCNSIVMASLWINTFITLAVFIPLVEAVGLAPVFYIFSFVSFCVTLFSVIYVPETKGLSVIEIQKLFCD